MQGRRISAKHIDYDSIKVKDFLDKDGKEKTPEDEKVLAYLKTLEDKFEDSRRHMKLIHERWKTNMTLYRNKFLMNVPDGYTKMRFNIPLAVIETQMPIIADNLPTFYVKANEEDDEYFAQQMQLRKKKVLRDISFKDKVLDSIHDSLIYSNGIILIRTTHDKVIMDSEGRKIGDDEYDESTGNNRIIDTVYEMSAVNMFTFYPSSDAIGLDIRNEAEYIIFATPKSVSWIKRVYGADVVPEGYLDENSVFQLVEEADISKDGFEDNHLVKQALVKECYRMDDTDESDKYPNGRATIWANKVLLQDGAMGPADEKLEHSCMPYFMISNYKTAHTWRGMGEPELVNTQTATLAYIMSSIADNIRRTGNPVLKILHGALKNLVMKIRGIAGEHMVLNSHRDVEWEKPPAMPAYIFKFIELVMTLTDVITGQYDVARGQKPGQITAAAAIAELQEVAQSRVRYKITKPISKFINQMGIWLVYLMQTYDKKPLKLREEDVFGEVVYHDYDPIGMYDKDGIKTEDSEKGKTLKDSNLDIDVITDTEIAGGRLVKESRATILYDKGIFPIEWWVKESTIEEKQAFLDAWYKDKGLRTTLERQESLTDNIEKIENIVEKVLKLWGSAENAVSEEEANNILRAWFDSLDEDRLMKLIDEYPEYLKLKEWEMLPVEVRDRVLKVFSQPVEEEAEIQEEGVQI